MNILKTKIEIESNCSGKCMWGIPGRFDQAVTLTFLFLFFSFKYVMDDHKKMTHQFSDFFLNFSSNNGRNRRRIRTVTDSFETYTINSLLKQKFFESNFIVFHCALFWETKPKQKIIIIIFLPISLKWHHFLGKIFSKLFLSNFGFSKIVFIKFWFFQIFLSNFFSSND